MSEPLRNPAATWDERFAGDDYVFGTEPNEYLRVQARHLPARGRLLCVADGEGRNSVWLARQGHRVEAFDLSTVGVEKARRLAQSARVGIAYSVCGCDDWAWLPNTYDGVAAIFVQFADPPMRTRLFAGMIDCLKEGGILIVQGYTPRQLEFKTGGPPLASQLYTQELLRREFASMEILDLREYDAELHEGSRHHGRSALLGMVARKRASQA